MQANNSIQSVVRKYRNLLALSLVISLVSVPIVDAFIVERDRNRNMLYGELFLTEGFDVYDFTDRMLNETYDIPADHLLTQVHNVSYEYPIVTLLFYSGLAALEPGWFGPHYIANITLVLIFHLNVVLFLYAGQEYWNRKWFWFFGAVFYFFGFCMSVGFGKADPLANLFWLVSYVFYQKGRMWESNVALGIAFQTKIYPIMTFPILAAANPLAIIGFLGTILVLYIPLLISGIKYTALFEHFFSSSEYATSITNPFYYGHALTNPIAIIASLSLVIAFLYAIFESKKYHGIPVISMKLRTKNWKSIYIYAIPLSLIFVSWVLIWYYAWLIIPMLYFDNEEDKTKYCYIAFGLFFAHALGLLLNLQYFIDGPILAFLSHFKSI